MNFWNRIYFHLLLVKVIYQAWIKSPKAAKGLLKELWREYQSSPPQVFKLWVMARCLTPNYRLKTKIKLGRPSVTIFRKFYDFFRANEVLCADEAVNLRKRTKYLIIRDGAMGDVLMLTPVVRALHARHGGDIAIDIATKTPVVFDNSPYVRAVLDPKALRRGIYTYDVVIDLNDVYERAPHAHPVIAYAHVVLGTSEFDKKLVLSPGPEDARLMDSVVAEIGAPYVVVHHLRHEWGNREIDAVIWSSIYDGFERRSDLKIIFVGSHRDHAPARSANFEDHRERYSIQQLSLLIAKSQGFLGGDSGPSHVAAATDVPIAVFYTCAHHEARMPLRSTGRFLPLKPHLDCYGCLSDNPIPRAGYFCSRGDNACVRAFDATQVTHQVMDFFKVIL